MTEFIVIIQKEFNPQKESDIISIDGKDIIDKTYIRTA